MFKAERQTKEKCAACGTSPFSHNLLFFLNFCDETIGRLNTHIVNKYSTGKYDGLIDWVEKKLNVVLSSVYAIRYNKDIEKAATGRSKLIWGEANDRKISMEQIVLFGKHMDYYRANINGKLVYFQSLPIPPWLAQKGYNWVDDKFILAQKLSTQNLPSPKTKTVFIHSKNKNQPFESLQKPLIIKPRNGSRGRHTTTNINTLPEFQRALKLANAITPVVVVQEHLFGSVYRATVINNKLVGFFRADPPRITGDGLQTISQLIDEKNKNKHEKLAEVLIQEDLIKFIERQGYSLGSVLEKGITIDLSAKTGRMYGGYTKEMLPEVHSKMHDIFRKAGEIANAPVLGFDLIIEEPKEDPDLQRWGIIECNSLPFIDLHYFALEGEPVNLAKNVWDLWETKN